MRYQSARTKTCLLLSSLVASAVSGGGDRLLQHQTSSSSTTHSNNNYLESIMRKLETSGRSIVTDRRGRSKSCAIGGIENCASTYYYYKDFEEGATFAEAHAAIGTEADLEHCVLAPIYSYQDLVEISEAIPPCKAAYTAAYKDPLRVYQEAKTCISNGENPNNCDYEPLGKSLKKLWDGANPGDFGVCSLEEWFRDSTGIGGETWCPALKTDGWVNFGSTEEIPSGIWRDGDSSYCGEGPIHNAAAAFATDYTASGGEHNVEPAVFLKTLNSGECLPGAVYKCCQQEVAACFHE